MSAERINNPAENEVTAVQLMSEWDHGVEPNPLDASFSANSDEDVPKDQHEIMDIFLESPKRMAKKMTSIASKLLHEVSVRCDKAIHSAGGLTEAEKLSADTMKSDRFIVPPYIYPEDRM